MRPMPAVFLSAVLLPTLPTVGQTPFETWIRTWNGPAGETDTPSAIALGPAGVHIVGSANGMGSVADVATLTYDTSGDLLWAEVHDGPAGQLDLGSEVAVDAAGNVYVMGASASAGTGPDVVTIKYDPGGRELWVARYEVPGLQLPRGLALDVDGNVHVTLESPEGPHRVIKTIKYAPDGETLWIATYAAGPLTDSFSRGLAVDADGHVYVTGERIGPPTAGGAGIIAETVTIRYDADGNELWQRAYSSDSGWVTPDSIALDGAANAYVLANDIEDILVLVKYDLAGDELWTLTLPLGSGQARDLQVDAMGNAYFIASVQDVDDSAYVTAKYSPAGNPIWIAVRETPGFNTSAPTELAVDASSNVYVTGFTVVLGEPARITTVKYDAGGQERWSAHVEDAVAAGIVVDDVGMVYVTGRDGADDIITVKYTSCPGDTDASGVVDVLDLIAVIAAWGTSDPAVDVNGDGIVNVQDLTLVIQAWGPCE